MTELETLEMLERCLEILVETTPQCKECKMRWYDGKRYLCYFAANCFCEEDSYLKNFKKKEDFEMKEIISEAVTRNLIEFMKSDDGLGEWVFNDVADKFAYTTNALDVIHEINTQIEEIIKILKDRY